MTTRSTTDSAAQTLAVRAQLVEALKLDLVGPSAGHALAAEQLPDSLRPASWYLTGFLIPSGTPAEQASDLDEDDELEAVAEQTGLDQEANEDRRAAKKDFFPSSIGLTFLVPAQARELSVTLLNVHKPRDRSHYERFRHYHETFYRSVEATSVTPFSPRALDRGFAGALVALARHAEPALSPPKGVAQIAQVRTALERYLITVFQRRVEQQEFADADERDERLRAVQNRIVDLLDSWQTIVDDYQQATVTVQYQPYEGSRNTKPLLRDTLETQFESPHHRKFRASRSLRDVEPDVNLYLRDANNQLVEE